MCLFKRFIFIFFLCFTSLLFAHTYQGELIVLIADDFEHKKSHTSYELNEAGIIYRLELPKAMEKNNFLSGDKVTLEGLEIEGLKDKTIKVESLIIQQKNTPSVRNRVSRDNRKILPLLINFNNMRATNTVSVRNVDSMLYTNLKSTQRNFLRNSLKQLNFTRVRDEKGNTFIHVVNLNYNAVGCNYNKWANDALTAITEAGIDVSLFRHHLFVLPRNAACNWGGLGYLGCGSSCRTWIIGYDPSLTYSHLVYTHELGHNLGMDHSATDTNNDGNVESEYGDAACVMGTGDFQYYKELNAAHRDQMGWFDNYPGRIVTATPGSTYQLFPLEAGLNHTQLLALKIPRNSMETYYFSLRKNRGLFGVGAPSYLDRISVHKTIKGDYHTYFIKSLASGESFVDRAANIKFTPIIIGTYYAMVHIG